MQGSISIAWLSSLFPSDQQSEYLANWYVWHDCSTLTLLSIRLDRRILYICVHKAISHITLSPRILNKRKWHPLYSVSHVNSWLSRTMLHWLKHILTHVWLLSLSYCCGCYINSLIIEWVISVLVKFIVLISLRLLCICRHPNVLKALWVSWLPLLLLHNRV